MRRADVISGVILAVFGLITLFIIIPWQIEPGPAGYMSPRLVPVLMMVLITGLSVLLAVRNLASGAAPGDEPPLFTWAEMLAIVKIATVFAVAIALYFWVSPAVSGGALVAGSLIALGERRPWVIVAMPAGLLITVWLLFYKVLGTAIV